MRKTRRKILLAIGSLIGLAIGFVAVEHWRGARALAKWEAAMHAKGEKLTIRELTPSVPPGVNGAGDFQSNATHLPRLGRVLLTSLPGVIRILPSGRAVSLLQYTNWPERGYVRSGGTNRLGPSDLAADVAKGGRALASVHAALRQPVLDFGINYERGYRANWLYRRPLKETAHWLRGAALDAVYRREFDAAVTNLEAIAILAQTLIREPLLTSQTNRIAIETTGIGALWEVLPAVGWSDPQLARLQAAWQFDGGLAALRRALPMDSAMAADVIDHRSTNGLRGEFGVFGTLCCDDRVLAEARDAVANFTGQWLVYPFWSAAWADQDRLHLGRHLRAWEDGLRELEPYPGIVQLANLDRAISRKFVIETAYDRARFRVSALRAPERTFRAATEVLENETLRRMAVAAIALERHRLRHSQYPEALMALVPEFLPGLPMDFMDGQPLRYRLKPDGHFALWSVGRNGTDEGGSVRPVFTDELGLNDRRDLVWPEPATPEEIADAEAKRQR